MENTNIVSSSNCLLSLIIPIAKKWPMTSWQDPCRGLVPVWMLFTLIWCEGWALFMFPSFGRIIKEFENTDRIRKRIQALKQCYKITVFPTVRQIRVSLFFKHPWHKHRISSHQYFSTECHISIDCEWSSDITTILTYLHEIYWGFSIPFCLDL